MGISFRCKLIYIQTFSYLLIIIYFHNKNPGKTANYEMVEWRNKYIIDVGEWKKDKKFDIDLMLAN